MRFFIGAVSVLSAATQASASLNCIFQIENENFDFTPLGRSIHSVSSVFNTPPTVSNTSWYISPCDYLGNMKDNAPEDSHLCPSGTQSEYYQLA